MFGSSFEDASAAVLAHAQDMLDALRRLPLGAATGEQLLGFLQDLETGKRQLVALEHQLVADIDSRGLAGAHACKDTTTLLVQLLRIHPGEAGARVRAAAELGPRLGLSGEVLAPIFPRVAAAQAAGSISAAHALIITATIDALPSAVQAEHDESVQDFLLEQAHLLDPKLLTKIARRINDTLNPDGTLTRDRDQARRRELSIAQRADGSAQLHGDLTPTCAEAFLSVLDTLARPVPEADGVTDPRTAGQRRHDGLQDAALMLLRSGVLPDCGGVAATILLTMTEQQAETKTGLVSTGTAPRSPSPKR